MVRFYLVPVESVAGTVTRRGPKYFPWRFDPDPPALVQSGDDAAAIHWEARDYGNEPLLLLSANTSDADDASLAALSDVVKFSDSLDTPLGAQLSQMQAALEAMNLPAQMLTVNTTARQIVRGVMAIFGVAQCMQGKGFNVFGGGVTLATRMNQLSAAARTALQDCATSLGYDISSITSTSTVRNLLTVLVQQASPSPMMGVTV